jgi:hypothetical protein
MFCQYASETDYDPFFTAFLAYSSDTSPADMREIPFGRGSRIRPYLEDLSHTKHNQEHHYKTSNDDITVAENPDPDESRHAQTQVIVPPDVLEIDVGQAFEELSDKFSPAFRDYMRAFRWRVDLRQYRTDYCH